MTGERERETLDLLLTTTITPGQILWGKLIVGFRVSAVLTSFLLWPLLLGGLMVSDFWSNWLSLLLMFAIVGMTCVTNAIVAMFCSAFARKTSISLMSTYAVLLFLYAAPMALVLLLSILDFDAATIAKAEWFGIASPFNAAFSLPLDEQLAAEKTVPANVGNWMLVIGYFVVSAILNGLLMLGVTWRLSARQRFAD